MNQPHNGISDMIKRGVQDVELGKEIRDLGLEILINWKHSKDLFTFRKKPSEEEPSGKYPVLYVVVGKSEDNYSVKVEADPYDNSYSRNTDLTLKREDVVGQIKQFLTEIESKYI